MDARLPAGPDQPGGQRATRTAARPVDAGVERRLAALEARLDDLDEAIREVLPAAIRQTVEAACREAVGNEMQQVTENLRRSVSELGRLLLRDLDRLTKLLAEHRDAIVERLLEPLEGDVDGAGGPGEEPAVYVFDPPTEPEDPGPEPNEDGAPAAFVGEEGRWRVLPGRKRGKGGGGRGRARRGHDGGHAADGHEEP